RPARRRCRRRQAAPRPPPRSTSARPRPAPRPGRAGDTPRSSWRLPSLPAREARAERLEGLLPLTIVEDGEDDRLEDIAEVPAGAEQLVAVAGHPTGVVAEDATAPRPQDEDSMPVPVRRRQHLLRPPSHGILVLGAWGCGVFRNDPGRV